MDIKEEIRRRVADLTRFAYERGYRDGAQSALAEIETIAAENLVEQLDEQPAVLEHVAGDGLLEARPVKTRAKRRVNAKQKPAPNLSSPKSLAKSSAKSPAKQPKARQARSTSKLATVQAALQSLLDANGEARRDQILAAAQAANPDITRHDLNNGLRALTKQAAIRQDPEDRGRLLPA